MSIASIQQNCRRLIAKAHKQADTPTPSAYAKSSTQDSPAYAQIQREGQALFETGQAESAWAGMGMFCQDHPEIYREYLREKHAASQATTAPTSKASPLTYDAVVKQATSLMRQHPTLSKREALIKLIETHPGERAYQAAYRTYHLGEGREEFEAARIAKHRQS